LVERQKEQAEALAMGAALVKTGGRLVYVTCSILDAENDDTVSAFLATHGDFKPMGWKKLTRGGPLEALKDNAWLKQHGIQMTPRKTGTDGFYVSVLERK
jgi:16S rRNA (cytosine967-C5)-methyltransferase